MENLLNFIFPPRCKFCNRFGHVVCPVCLGKTQRLQQQYCLVCGKESFSGFTHEKCMYNNTPYRLFSLFSYEGVVRDGIKYSKYDLYEFSILKKITEHGISEMFRDLESFCNSIFIPVPVSRQKLMKRGFNHAELIAQLFARKLKNIKVVDLISRCVDTPTQHDLDRAKRFENVKNAFSLKKGAIKLIADKNLVLVDDIVTSGATLLESAKTLYLGGAKSVACVTLSRKLLV